MGAWDFVRPSLEELAGTRRLAVLARPRSSSPAEGSAARHAQNQEKLIARAFEMRGDGSGPEARGSKNDGSGLAARGSRNDSARLEARGAGKSTKDRSTEGRTQDPGPRTKD